MNYKELTDSLVKRCIRMGADSAEVYLQTGRNLSIRVRNADIETIQEASTAGIGIRLIVDGKIGFSHSNDMNRKSLDDSISRAIAFAKLTTPDESNMLPSDTGFTDVEGLYDPRIAQVSMDRKIEMALRVEELAMKDPRITHSSGSSFGEREGEVFIANSNGLSKSYKASFCSVGLGVVAEKGDQRRTGWESSTRRFFDDLESLEEIASSAARKAWEILDPRMVKTQRAPVIFDATVAPSLLGGVIAAINGERVLQGASFLRNMMDQQFASSLLTITDDGTRARGLGSSPFDGEGVPTSSRVLVEKGVLRGFLYNTQVAARAGVQSTGNASRGGYSSLPGISTHNLYLGTGNYSQEEIIAATGRGLLLKGVTGYGINPVNGNFSGGATGLWIENGRVAYPVEGLAIAGNAEQILKGIDMMGNDIDMNRSFASPSFRIAEMQIGGA
jgi:PmbA protein